MCLELPHELLHRLGTQAVEIEAEPHLQQRLADLGVLGEDGPRFGRVMPGEGGEDLRLFLLEVPEQSPLERSPFGAQLRMALLRPDDEPVELFIQSAMVLRQQIDLPHRGSQILLFSFHEPTRKPSACQSDRAPAKRWAAQAMHAASLRAQQSRAGVERVHRRSACRFDPRAHGPCSARGVVRTVAVLLGLAGFLLGDALAVADGGGCSPVPLFENGRVARLVCVEQTSSDLTVLDLADDWVPAIFSETTERPQSYRPTFVALANEKMGEGVEWDTARRDRYFELYGIFPSFSVVRARLRDDARHDCHGDIDDRALRDLHRTLAPWTTGSSAATSAALTVVQQHLRCEGLFDPDAATGAFDARTQEGLRLYQRRYMLPSAGILDSETRDTLLTDSGERDFRTLLRVLRERVVDATGLVEDGSALNAWEPVFGRFIDSAEYRQAIRPEPVPHGAPDLIARATEAAAAALGWTSPAAAAQSLARGVVPRVALRLPPRPAYHSAVMELRAEIDRGDVWTSYPLDAEGRPRPSPVKSRPTLTLYAKTTSGDVALIRWPTTIGAWKQEKLDEDSGELRYKASPIGQFFWRDLVAAPAWFPPPTTPDRELVRRGPDGRWRGDHEAVGPGYRSAYGLVALIHDRAVVTSAGTSLADVDIRTHGSGNYRSILRGSSHGCHRLFNHLAIRLASFLLAHRAHERFGVIDEQYARVVHWKGRTLKLHAESRGYRYEIEPAVPVSVLPGRIVRSRPLRAPQPAAPQAPGPGGAPAPTIPQT